MTKSSGTNGGGGGGNGAWSLDPIENLKGFATTRPPLIVFMVCLGVFGLVLMTLAFYVKDAALKKPNLSQDWNVFLESFSDLEFCIHNGTAPPPLPPSRAPHPPVVTKASANRPMSTPADPVTTLSRGHSSNQELSKNYSVSMLLAIHPTPEFLSIPHNLTSLHGFVYGEELGLQGAAATQRINIAMQLPFEWNSTSCDTATASCSVVRIYTCVYFHAAESVFPATRHPQACETLNDTGVEYHASLLGHKPTLFGSSAVSRECRARTRIKIHYHIDPTLTVLLSLSDRSVINLHLLHTSYFLFVMTITLLLYATIRGRPVRIKYPFSSLLSTSTTDI